MSQPILVFTHIPKTGGITLRHIIQKNLPADLIWDCSPFHSSIKKLKELTPSQIEKLQCVYGHCAYGVHDYLKRPVQYITFIRDPIDRAISLYYYLRSRSDCPDILQDMNLDSYLNSSYFIENIDNIQTKYVFGAKKIENIYDLEDKYTFIGVTDLYPESVYLFNKTLGWPQIHCEKYNKSLYRPEVITLHPETLNSFKERNLNDLLLYDYCKQKLLERLNQCSPQEKLELNEFIKVQRQLK